MNESHKQDANGAVTPDGCLQHQNFVEKRWQWEWCQ